jgi:hypothetical protein
MVGLSVRVTGLNSNDAKTYPGVTALTLSADEATLTLTQASGNTIVDLRTIVEVKINHAFIYQPGTTPSDRPPGT